MKKFSCHGCAGCCHGSISLTYNEVIHQFSGEFPLIIAYVVSDVRNVPVEKDKSPYSKGMKKFTKDAIGFYDKTQNNRKIVVHPQILSLIPADAPCPHLDLDNLCTIYGRKPSVCTLYPYRIDTPISWMEDGLARERNNAYEGVAHIPCEGWTDDAPVIYSAGKPVDDDVIPLLKSRTADAITTRDRLKGFYQHLKSHESVIEKIDEYSKLNEESGRLLQFNFSQFMHWQAIEGIIHPYVAKVAIKGQIKQLELANKQINLRTDDVAETYKGMYSRYLQESTDLLLAL